jgi:hypothetical protein
LRFSADGTWTQLGAAEPLTPAGGTWQVIDIGSQNWQGSYQLNLVVGSGTFITIPTVGADGIHLRLGAFGGCAGDYVRSGAVPAPAHARRIQDVWVDATPLARQPDATSGELCQHAAERVEDATSRGRVLAGLPGLWKLCGGTTPFWQSSESGLELGADGRWFKLYADASGSLWRALSWGERGTWEVLEDTGQLNLYAYGSGTYIVNPVRLSSDGQQLELNSTGQIGEYARFSAP